MKKGFILMSPGMIIFRSENREIETVFQGPEELIKWCNAHQVIITNESSLIERYKSQLKYHPGEHKE